MSYSLSVILFWTISIIFFILLSFLGKKYNLQLWLKVIIALFAGMIMGFIFGGQVEGCNTSDACVATQISFMGQAFIRLIRMLIVPLIFATLVAGIVQAHDIKRLGKIGIQAMSLYLFTTFLAVILGLIMATILKPGVGANLDQAGQENIEFISQTLEKNNSTILQTFINIIPANPIEALAKGDVLSIIFFAIMLGVAILFTGKNGEPVAKFFNSASDIMLKLTDFVMVLAPFGVYALMSNVVASQGLSVLVYLAKLFFALYIACLIHIIFVYGGIIKIFAKLPIIRYFRGIIDAQAVAYSTSSSSATLPVTLRNVTNNLGVHKEVAASVLPIGSTINMDGTSIYLGLIALFAAQAFGIEPTMADYILIAITACLVSIGTAGIPSASLFLAMTVLAVFKDPAGNSLITTEMAVLVIAFVFPFDRLLDMMRTVTNVSGDAMVSLIVGKMNNMMSEDTYRAKNEKENKEKAKKK